MANIRNIEVSPNPMLKNTSTDITVTFDVPVRGLSATDFTDPNGDIENVTIGEGVTHVFKFTPDADYTGMVNMRLRGGGWWDVATGAPGRGKDFNIEVVESLPNTTPPTIVDFKVEPVSPTADETVLMTIDFSIPTTLAGAGVLADGEEDVVGKGYDVGEVTQGAIDSDTYRWTIELVPNSNLVEGKKIEFLLPAGNYQSLESDVSGTESAEVVLNPPKPPVLKSIEANPLEVSIEDKVELVLDFSEAIYFEQGGLTLNEGDPASVGLDLVSQVMDQVYPDTYRITYVFTPNSDFNPDEPIVISVPEGGYVSPATGLPGEVSGQVILNEQEDTPTNPEDSQMATNHILWHQGHVNPQYPNCGGCKEGSPPSSKHIAAEYQRGMYTLTNVIYPYTSQYNPSNLGPVKDCLDKVKPGDTVYMTLVPPMHRILDAAMFTYDTLEPGSMLGSLAGMELALVSAIIDEDGNVTEVKNVSSKKTLPSATTEEDGTVSDPKQVFAYRAYASEFTEVGEWMAFGLKISKLPESGASLADIKAGLAVAVHALGFDSQIQMG